MERNYCNKCGKRRLNKFMKTSPTNNKEYCYKSITFRGFNKLSCFDIHISEESIRLSKEIKQIKKYLQEDKSTSVKMSNHKDKNQQLNLIDMIEEILKN